MGDKVIRVEVQRIEENDFQTIGILKIMEGPLELLRVKTLELADKQNQRNISRIPSGTYKAVRHYSPKFGECIWIKNVPQRTGILIHPGNFYTQIQGCILVGDAHRDINGDNLTDVTASRSTMKKIMRMVPDHFQVIIMDSEKSNKPTTI